MREHGSFSIVINLAVYTRVVARAFYVKFSHDFYALDLCGEFESCLYYNFINYGVGSVFGKNKYVYKEDFHLAEILIIISLFVSARRFCVLLRPQSHRPLRRAPFLAGGVVLERVLERFR